MQLEMVLPSLPVVVPVEKNTTPFVTLVLEAEIVQLVIVLFEASAIKRIADVPAVAEVLRLLIVTEFPAVFKPSMVILSAPFKFIKGNATVPESVRAPTGFIVRLDHVPVFKLLAPVSVVTFAVIEIIILFPGTWYNKCRPALSPDYQ